MFRALLLAGALALVAMVGSANALSPCTPAGPASVCDYNGDGTPDYASVSGGTVGNGYVYNQEYNWGYATDSFQGAGAYTPFNGPLGYNSVWADHYCSDTGNNGDCDFESVSAGAYLIGATGHYASAYYYASSGGSYLCIYNTADSSVNGCNAV